MDAWVDLVDRIRNPVDEVTIHVVGKYVGYEDSYKSLNEALYHGGFKHRLRVNIRWVEAEALEQPGGEQLLDGAHGILVPGGFGDRGTRGMMRAAEIARERRIPYFGICYGFQWAAVEYARHVCGLAEADSTECSPDTPIKVIYKLRDLLGVDDLGGTMRLGSYACELKAGSKARELYGEPVIHERHRHRYEFNCLYEKTLTENGLDIVGRSTDGKFVEIVELPSHPVVRRGAVPPGVQVEAAEAAPAVRRIRRGERPAHARGRDAARRVRGRLEARAAHPVCWADDRRRRTAAAHRRALRHRERVARGRRRDRDARHRAPRRRAVRLQGVVRQGEPHLGTLVSRAGAERRAARCSPQSASGPASRS